MNLSEDQLRAELHDSLAATGRHLPTVDAVEVVAEGRRVVRRRRVAAVSATATVAAVLAIGIGVTLGGASRRDDRPGTTRTSISTSVDGSATLTLPGSQAADGTEATAMRLWPAAMMVSRV